MKGLSIKQPWASLIAHGIKDIENRTWKTHFRGRIYIHASGSFTKKDKEILHDLVVNRGVTCYDEETYPTSAIIGEVDIIDCVINNESIWAEESCEVTIYNWVLANPVLYEKPILNVKGNLSFWKPTPNQNCMNCGEKFFGQDPQYYCNGNMCGCMGQPIEPVVCSEKCYDKLLSKCKNE